MDKVTEILKDLEKKHDITIVYACESGSRAWNFSSDKSDYDIRFIYKHNDTKTYISLKSMNETIDGFSKDRIYDWQGFDIKKALRLVKQMNSCICEWLHSPIVYVSEGGFREKALNLLKDQKRIKPLYFHYMSMTRSNYKKHTEKFVNIKKYMCLIRTAAMVEWLRVFKRSRNFKIDFQEILNDLKNILDKDCYENILILRDIKITTSKDNVLRVKCIDDWIESLFKNHVQDFDDEYINNNSLEEYDHLLFSILEKNATEMSAVLFKS